MIIQIFDLFINKMINKIYIPFLCQFKVKTNAIIKFNSKIKTKS